MFIFSDRWPIRGRFFFFFSSSVNPELPPSIWLSRSWSLSTYSLFWIIRYRNVPNVSSRRIGWPKGLVKEQAFIYFSVLVKPLLLPYSVFHLSWVKKKIKLQINKNTGRAKFFPRLNIGVIAVCCRLRLNCINSISSNN